jgi:hypothetical protein
MSKFTSAKLAIVTILLTALGLTASATGSAGASEPQPTSANLTAPAAGRGDLWHRTELYFGRNRPGGEVSEEEFAHFVDVEVTKRFPDGLTLLSGLGQFQNENGVVEREQSKLLILLYPLNDRDANREIEEIRQAYKDQFQQFSVLRVDALERVSF